MPTDVKPTINCNLGLIVIMGHSHIDMIFHMREILTKLRKIYPIVIYVNGLIYIYNINDKSQLSNISLLISDIKHKFKVTYVEPYGENLEYYKGLASTKVEEYEFF